MKILDSVRWLAAALLGIVYLGVFSYGLVVDRRLRAWAGAAS